MKVWADRQPAWLKWIAPERFNDKDLFRIVTFFVFHSPCPNVSSMGRTLEQYGWDAPWQKPYKLNYQLRQVASNYNLIYSAKDYSSMSDALEKAGMNGDFPNNFETERACIYNGKKNQFQSLFYHLRNAFSHCRLNMVDYHGECIFILEDVVSSSKNNQLKVSARMILYKSTLLRWIDLIENGQKEYSKKSS